MATMGRKEWKNVKKQVQNPVTPTAAYWSRGRPSERQLGIKRRKKERIVAKLRELFYSTLESILQPVGCIGTGKRTEH